MIAAISRVPFDAWGVIAACLPPTDTYHLCLSSAYFHGGQQSDDKEIATVFLRKTLLSSLARVYKHDDIASDANLGIDRPHMVLTGNTMIQVLMGKVWDQQDHPKEDVWASCDRRHRTMIIMAKSSWDGEFFHVADPHRTINLQSTCNIELLDAHIGEIQHLMWADVSTPTRVIAGLHKVADILHILNLGYVDFEDLGKDCNRQWYLLDHYNLKGVDIQKVSQQVRSYIQSKPTVLHCRVLEQFVNLEDQGIRRWVMQLWMLQFSIDTVRALRKSRDDLIEISEKNLDRDREDFECKLEDQKMDLEFDQLREETLRRWDNTFTPAKHRLFARQRDELNPLHVTQYAERLVVPDQWRADPWYFCRYLCNTVLRTQHAKNEAEYTN